MAVTSPERRITLPDLLSNRFVPIQNSMLNILPLDDLTRLCSTSKAFTDLKTTAWNYKKFLLEYFKDPTEFRSLQGQWNALLTGEVFIDFFARTKSFDAISESKILDLVVSQNHREAVEDYLRNDGYTQYNFEPSRWWKYTKEGQRVTFGLNLVDIPPILFILTRQVSTTSTQNFATWNKAYSLFPFETFLNREGYLLSHMDERMARLLSRLSAAKYKTLDVAWRRDRYLTTHRRVGDRETWVMSLPTLRVQQSDVPDAVIESTTTRIRVSCSTQSSTPFYYHGTDIELLHPVLKYQYVLADWNNTEYQRKISWITKRLNSATIIEFYKIHLINRPALFWTMLVNPTLANRPIAHFVLPQTWTYYDNKVIHYLAEIEKEGHSDDKDQEIEVN